MYDGPVNKKSGVLVLTLPTILDSNSFTAPHEGEKSVVYPDVRAWTSVNTRSEYERRYPSLPDRLIDNLLKPEAKDFCRTLEQDRERCTENFSFWLMPAFENRIRCEYDLRRKMRRANS